MRRGNEQAIRQPTLGRKQDYEIAHHNQKRQQEKTQLGHARFRPRFVDRIKRRGTKTCGNQGEDAGNGASQKHNSEYWFATKRTAAGQLRFVIGRNCKITQSGGAEYANKAISNEIFRIMSVTQITL